MGRRVSEQVDRQVSTWEEERVSEQVRKQEMCNGSALKLHHHLSTECPLLLLVLVLVVSRSLLVSHLTSSTVESYFIGMAIVYVATVMNCDSLAIVSRSHSFCVGLSFSFQRGTSQAQDE